MNIVFIITDTQRKDMVGAYGQPGMDTPNLDRLAADGIRFERAYTACPVCTPARGAIFTGLTPQSNGAWANCLATYRHLPMMGEIFRHYGYRAGYTGKWHLDGTDYDGSGIPDGGFEPDWWHDRANHLAELPPDIRQLYRQDTTPEKLRDAGFTDQHVYGYRVADRAVDFLEQVGDDDFILAVSFDEPHDPWMVTPDYWEKFTPADLPEPGNYCPEDQADKPKMHRVAAAEIAYHHDHASWQELVAKRLKFFGANAYIDRQIGRVIEAVDRRHADDTVIIYTSDHGDQLGCHGMHDKGPWMYEETTNIPFIVRAPFGQHGAVCHQLVSHLDILPTMLDLAGIERPESLHGKSFRALLENPEQPIHDHVMVSFNNFGLERFSNAGLWPIRMLTDGRYKLVINLLDTDELYDLADDPLELTNRLHDPALASLRNQLHDRLLAEMRRTRDPMWSPAFHDRPWRPTPLWYCSRPGDSQPTPKGFPFAHSQT